MILECEIEATPAQNVTWYRGDQKLEFGKRIQALAMPVPGGNKTMLSLIINKVGTSDSGTYKVEVKNALGQISASINLNLSGKNLVHCTHCLMKMLSQNFLCKYLNDSTQDF